MDDKKIKVNSIGAWVLASRPKTLAGAMVPVMIGLALAAMDRQMQMDWIPAVLCMLFAVTMQVEANFVNDYFDWQKGNDDMATRLGPLRACSMGWITPKAMVCGMIVTAVLAGITGLPLVLYGGWEMMIVGVVCVAFCVLYTTTLSYLGLGDVLVLVFFGIVPVSLTYYLQTGIVTLWTFILSVACGLAIDNLLIINNYRDIDNDRRDGKRTLIVVIGRKSGLALYLALGIIATLLVCAYAHFGWQSCVMLFYLVPHLTTYTKMRMLDGKALNAILGKTARNVLLFGIATSAVVLAGEL